MRRTLSTLAVCALALASCGGHSHKSHPVVVSPQRACNPNNYAMQCALTTPPPGLLTTPLGGVHGLDFGWSGISVATAKSGGFRFGASYLSFDASKNWTRSLVNSYHAAGLATVSVWETSATRALSGFGGGQADARAALGQSFTLGSGYRPIYFAIDFDETAAQSVAVAGYFQGIHAVLDEAGPVSFPHQVPVGAYGGYWAVKRLFDAHLISYGWQTYAWSGGRWDPRAQLQQYLNGSTFDYDRAVQADYGQTPYNPGPVLAICFHKRETTSACNAAKRQVASAQRAVTSSQRAYTARGCPGLAQRTGWFSSHLNRPPSSRRAYRAGALKTSRRVYQARGCSTFLSRERGNTGLINRIKAAN